MYKAGILQSNKRTPPIAVISLPAFFALNNHIDFNITLFDKKQFLCCKHKSNLLFLLFALWTQARIIYWLTAYRQSGICLQFELSRALLINVLITDQLSCYRVTLVNPSLPFNFYILYIGCLEITAAHCLKALHLLSQIIRCTTRYLP